MKVSVIFALYESKRYIQPVLSAVFSQTHKDLEVIAVIGSPDGSKEELQKDFEHNGITNDKEIICYCHSGARASHKYLQLKQAGFHNIRVYDGSIIDWAQRHNPLR